MTTLLMLQEEWRPLRTAPGYSASSLGRVRRDAIIYGGGGSVRYPKDALAQRALPTGHRQVTVSIGNSPRTFLVHRLVAEAFLPQPEAGKNCVCHRDDDPSNNLPNNLFWGSKADNSADMVRKGRQKSGVNAPGAKLTEERVTELRRRASNGEDQYELATEFGICQSNVSTIVARKTWRHVP